MGDDDSSKRAMKEEEDAKTKLTSFPKPNPMPIQEDKTIEEEEIKTNTPLMVSDIKALQEKIRTDLETDILNKYNSSLKKMKEQYEIEINKLKSTISEQHYRLTENKLSDKGVAEMIDNIRIDVYYISTKLEKYKCHYCEAFLNGGYLDRLKLLYQPLKLNSDKFTVTEIKIDWCDIWINNDPYNENLTQEGFNYYYTIGMGIDKLPALDLWITFKKEKSSHLQRLQGFGHEEIDKEGNKIVLITVIDDIIQYLIDLVSGKLDAELRSSSLHKQNEVLNDPLTKNNPANKLK